MKNLFICGAAALALTAVTVPAANALPKTITMTHEYGSGSGKIDPGGTDPLGTDYVKVRDTSATRFNDSFEFDASAFQSIDQFALTLTFGSAGPSKGCIFFVICSTAFGEDWTVRVQGSDKSPRAEYDDFVGQLSDTASPQTFEVSLSTDAGPVDAFNQAVSTEVFEFWFASNSTGADQFKLYSAQLEIDGIAAVPLPAGAWLLGGMTGLGLWAARRKSKA